MKKWLLLTILMLSFSFALEVDVNPTTSLEKDHAYVISALGLSNTNTVDYISGNLSLEGGNYRLAPQVIVYDGTTKFIGTATKFTGCFNDIKYVDSTPSGGCGILKTDKIEPENIKYGVAVSYGLENNPLTTVTGTFTGDATASANQILSGQTAYVIYPRLKHLGFLRHRWKLAAIDGICCSRGFSLDRTLSSTIHRNLS